jgi:hypothetical protein
MSRQLRQDLAAASLRQHLKKAAEGMVTSLMVQELLDRQIQAGAEAQVEQARRATARQVRAVRVS